MNNDIIQQQLELHFGDTYRDVATQALRFCKSLMYKPWWGQNRNIMLSNEGGVSGMKRHALLRVIELEDITAGLKDYGKYLRSEYGSDKILPSVDDIEVRSTIEANVFESFGDSNDLLSEESLQSQYGLFHKVLVTGEEWEFFRVYTSVRDVRETCALTATDIDSGWRLYKRVMERAARIMGER